MDSRRARADGVQQVAVIKRTHIARQPALHADLGRAPVPCLFRSAPDFCQRMIPRIGLAGSRAKGAEFTADIANVGKINVATDYVAHHRADSFFSEQIDGRHQVREIPPAYRAEDDPFVFADLSAGERALQDPRYLRINLR